MNSKMTLLTLILLLIVVGKSTWILYGKNKEAALKKNSLFRESKEIENRRIFLEREISNLKTEEGIEETLRQKFNIKKEGEEVLVIIDDTATDKDEEVKNLKTRFTTFLVQLKDIFR